MKTLTYIVMCFVVALCFAWAQEGSTVAVEDDLTVLIPKVQKTIAAELD